MGKEIKDSKESKEKIEGGVDMEDAYSRLFNHIDLRNWRQHMKKNAKT